MAKIKIKMPTWWSVEHLWEDVFAIWDLNDTIHLIKLEKVEDPENDTSSSHKSSS